MKVTAVFVSSINGKITQGSDPNPSHWASAEDQKHFKSLLAHAALIVMGRSTWEASRKAAKLSPDKLRIVMTSTPKEFETQQEPGQLEFTDESPKKLVSRLEKNGYKEMLMVGGAQVFAEFLKANLIDDLYLTIEPLVLTEGKNLIDDSFPSVKFKLVSSKKTKQQRHASSSL